MKPVVSGKGRKRVDSLKNMAGLCLILLMFSVHLTSAQSPARPTPKDVVVESNRRELDSLLLRKHISGSEDTAARQAVLKQINEDFKTLQVLNNRMMSDATASEEIDYRYLSDMISQVGNKAARLKANLALPKVEHERKKQAASQISNAAEFKSELLAFDKLIVSFVTNPIFKQTSVVEVDLANRASHDLVLIIELSGKLKRVAVRLGKK